LDYYQVYDKLGYYHRISSQSTSTVKKVTDSKIGCYIKMACMSILLYADYIILLAPSDSVTPLQQLLLLCKEELLLLGMSLNVQKSAYLRV